MNESDSSVGLLAISRAGHDSGQIYVVINETAGYVFLSDGKLKTQNNPKRKNKRHVQILKQDSSMEIGTRLQNGQSVADEEIKYMIKNSHI